MWWPIALPRWTVSPGGAGVRIRLDQARDLALDLAHGVRRGGADLVGVPLEVALRGPGVALHEPVHAVPALTELALQLRPGPLDLALEAVAGREAAALEFAQVGVHLAAELADLALRRVAAQVRRDRVDEVVARGERGADADQDRTLSLRGDGLEAGGLGLRRSLGRATGAARGRARLTAGRASARAGGAALTGRGGTLGAGT